SRRSRGGSRSLVPLAAIPFMTRSSSLAWKCVKSSAENSAAVRPRRKRDPIQLRSYSVAIMLDTDHFSILQQNGQAAANLQRRLDEWPSDELKVSIISFQEQAQGWLAF